MSEQTDTQETFLHPTPLLDELEKGPWPSFITGLKKLANRTHNTMVRGVLDQLEYSYETKMGYWKGGVVGVRGYGAGVIARFSMIADKFPEATEFHTLRVLPPAGLHYATSSLRGLCDLWEKEASGIINLHGQTGDLQLIGCGQDNVQHIFDELNKLGWDMGGAGADMRTGVACVGKARCEHACYDTLGVLRAVSNNYLDDCHRPSFPYKFKFKYSGCPNDCANSTQRSDCAVIGTWRDDIQVDHDKVGKFIDDNGLDYVVNSVINLCPTRAIELKGEKDIEINNKDCVRCMHCINVMTEALSPGKDRGVSILMGGKGHLKVGNMLGSLMVPFMKVETGEDAAKLIEFTDRVIDWWAENALDHERLGECIERHGIQTFLEAAGLEATPDMVEHPRDNPFFKAAY